MTFTCSKLFVLKYTKLPLPMIFCDNVELFSLGISHNFSLTYCQKSLFILKEKGKTLKKFHPIISLCTMLKIRLGLCIQYTYCILNTESQCWKYLKVPNIYYYAFMAKHYACFKSLIQRIPLATQSREECLKYYSLWTFKQFQSSHKEVWKWQKPVKNFFRQTAYWIWNTF